MQTHSLSYFLCKCFFGDDGFQNMIVYQPTLNTLKFGNEKSTIKFIVGHQRVYIFFNLKLCILLFCIA